MRQPTMTTLQALDVMGLTGMDINKEIIKTAFRNLTRKYHPDKGGDVKLFKEVVEAKNVLLKDISHAQTLAAKPEKKVVVDWYEVFTTDAATDNYAKYVKFYSDFRRAKCHT